MTRFVAFLGHIFILNQAEIHKKICCPVLEFVHCLPLLKTVLFVNSRAFSLSTPTFSMSTPLSTVSLHEKSYKMQQNWFELLLYLILNQSSETVIFEMVDFFMA